MTVRQMSTKDKPGTLPTVAYSKPAPVQVLVDIEQTMTSDNFVNLIDELSTLAAVIYKYNPGVFLVVYFPLSLNTSFGLVRLKTGVPEDSPDDINVIASIYHENVAIGCELYLADEVNIKVRSITRALEHYDI